MAEPQNPVNTIKLAYRGQAINIEDLKEATLPTPSSVTITSQYQDYRPSEDVDFTDLSNVTKEIIALRVRLHGIRIELKTAKRNALKAKWTYEKEKKRVWIGITGGSDKSREAVAELMTEQLMTDSLIASAVADEISQHNRDLRMDLDALKEISNNLRRQIDLQ
jgi:threonine synthase